MKTNHEHWIFLRGLGREQGHWGDFVTEFGRAFEGDQVLCIDLPGAGDARHVPPPTTLHQMTEYVRQAAREKVASGTFNILALSLGGMVALEWLHRFPQDLRSLVVINTSVAGLAPFYRRMRISAFPSFVSSALVKDPLQRERRIVDLISNRRENHDEIAERWRRLAVERPINHRSVVRQMIAASRFRLPKHLPAVPTLLLVGQGDRLVHPRCSEALHRRYGWPLSRHPWAGHDLPLDDTPWILNEVRKWRESQRV